MSDKNYNDEGLSAYDDANLSSDEYYTKRGSHPISKRHEKRTGCLGGLMYFIFIVSISVILACVGWMAASDVLALNKGADPIEVTLPDTIFKQKEVDITDSDGNVTGTETINVADIGEVATILKDAGIIKYKSLFKLYSGFSDAKDKMDPGTYTLNTEYDYRAIVKKMQFGSDSQVRTMVTFPEGFTMKEIFQRLEENKICKYDDLMNCAATLDFNYKFLENIPLGDASRLEGFLYPDTYEFYQGETPEATIDTFLQIFHYKLTADMWNLAAAKSLSMRDIINIAAMIEKEAANDDERATIASVIYNRLKTNMALGIDATIQYALPEHKDKLTEADFELDSPYNTRKYTGLPPTPIANPGFPSIMAALKPATTTYLYYALDTATGTHKFFKSASEFNAFVATQDYS